MQNLSKERTVAFISLGCAKNLVDSEKMLGQLAEAGVALTNDEASADVIVVNTCGFLEASRREAIDVIGEAVERKRSGVCGRVVVAGCLVQRDQHRLLDEAPGIDAIVGVNNRDDIVRAVLGGESESRNGSRRGRKSKRHRQKPDVYLSDYHPFVQLDFGRLRLTPRHYAYLRISEGCNQKCTFCTIPSIRGAMHCKPPEIVLAEARELAADGAVEISLIGQDTSSYGEEFDSEYDLSNLLRALNEVDGAEWIRLMYVYPTVMSDRIIDAMADSPRITKYVDMPLQHINDRMLKAMHRRVTRSETESLISRIRERMPNVALRTTLIAGFPGETEAEFEELVDFVRETEFDALGVFPYSLEPETPAGRMRDQLPDKVKEERVEALMLAQQDVAFRLADRMRDRRFRVLIDGFTEDGVAIGRHEGQAPSVDSVTFVSDCDAAVGEFLEVRCVGRRDYDLVATPTSVALPVMGRA
jgi:ribosomal protein S12 methylthiotransferase